MNFKKLNKLKKKKVQKIYFSRLRKQFIQAMYLWKKS